MESFRGLADAEECFNKVVIFLENGRLNMTEDTARIHGNCPSVEAKNKLHEKKTRKMILPKKNVRAALRRRIGLDNCLDIHKEGSKNAAFGS
ncbi:hypothetical protein HPP92_028710 [Vanilla planifolia]|uniref:Uncharacterized protein n=1 Tax=Vanilla planifolia TaxID=51239 RepID=A0A835P7N1_VANPL|nr:hypothetical protein HPP92_028710 [Vanilla planifolia]KAG0446717.1 hypothetical protein HPP92_028693 [Vanilla planifolia]